LPITRWLLGVIFTLLRLVLVSLFATTGVGSIKRGKRLSSRAGGHSQKDFCWMEVFPGGLWKGRRGPRNLAGDCN